MKLMGHNELSGQALVKRWKEGRKKMMMGMKEDSLRRCARRQGFLLFFAPKILDTEAIAPIILEAKDPI